MNWMPCTEIVLKTEGRWEGLPSKKTEQGTSEEVRGSRNGRNAGLGSLLMN
jgi:hypothetical protein